MKVVRTLAQARARAKGKVGLVPTMGFFHEGHLSLMEHSRAECDQTVVTLYVNPLQFEDPADLARYPADHERDLAMAEQLGVDIVVLASPTDMFASPPLTRVTVADLGEGLEGQHRPGHLVGVATVVAKLLAGVQPDRAYFGRKDAQQLAVVERMVTDLSLPVEVVGCPLVREPDGLALSSRNIYLGNHRPVALALHRGLMAAADAIEAGERRAGQVEEIVRTAPRPPDNQPDLALEWDYIAVVDAYSLQPVTALAGEVLVAVAARVGQVRLIDNVRVTVESDGPAQTDRGVTLPRPSILYAAPQVQLAGR